MFSACTHVIMAVFLLLQISSSDAKILPFCVDPVPAHINFIFVTNTHTNRQIHFYLNCPTRNVQDIEMTVVERRFDFDAGTYLDSVSGVND